MEARNRIWEELKQAKANILCIQYYTDDKRRWNRYYNGFIAITSSIGAFGSLCQDWIPAVAVGLVGLVSVAKSILPSFLQSESELSSLDVISDFYVRYMNDLEAIWYNFDKDYIDDKEAMKQFFQLKKTECEKQSVMNKGIYSISKKEQDRINKEAEEYIDKVYFNKY